MNATKTKSVEKRILSPKEIGQIRKYNLMPQVEAVVMDVWSKKPEIKKMSIGKRIIAKLIASITMVLLYLLPVLLWTKFLTPQNVHLTTWFGENYNHYMTGILRMYEFTMWIAGSIAVIIAIVGFVGLDKMEESPDLAFEKNNLDIWKGGYSFKKTINNLGFTAVIIGLVINAYFVLPAFLLVVFVIYTIFNSCTKGMVKRVMNTIIEKK